MGAYIGSERPGRSPGVTLTCRAAAAGLLAWYTLGLAVQIIDEEMYPALAMPQFPGTSGFDSTDMTARLFQVEYAGPGGETLRIMTPREMFARHKPGVTMTFFLRLFPPVEGEVIRAAEPELWDWAADAAGLGPGTIAHFRVVELRKAVGRGVSPEPWPTGNMLVLTPPAAPAGRGGHGTESSAPANPSLNAHTNPSPDAGIPPGRQR